MAGFADELRAGIDDAARKMAEERLAGDDNGAGAWRERLSYLRCAARRHGVELQPGADGEYRHDAASRPAAGAWKETE